MEIPSNWVTCDGCGLPASPGHVAERVNRLELATRFRPIHINVLFVAAAPSVRPEDDFYRPPESREFFDPLMKAVEIPGSGSDADRLVEFQRRGYYLSYLSECPLTGNDDVGAAISRLGVTLVRRIRFNYKPKHIAILGGNLSPLRDIFENAGMSANLLPLFDVPNLGDAVSAAQFRASLANLAAGASGVG
jgi:hypothetical protein